MNFVGIDPGKGGGLAFLLDDGSCYAWLKMPETERDLLEGLRENGPRVAPCRATLELVRSSPQMGVTSAFTFGRGYGALRMGLIALAIPFGEVVPRKWQQALGCRTGGDKNISKAKAQELFPNVRVTHANADALLLAEYGRRLELRT